MSSPHDAKKADEQSAEYTFPYHHLPHVDVGGRPFVGRTMRAGMEYLAYTEVVVEVVRELRPSSLLDVGCGDGRLIFELSDLVPDCRGVDLDDRALRYARSFTPRVDFAAERVQNLHQTFEVVTCVETLEHIPDGEADAFLAAAARRVTPSGHLIVTVPSTARPVHRKHHRHYDVEQLAGALRGLPGSWTLRRVEEVVPQRRWLELLIRLLGNRYWSVDAPVVNRFILARHRAAVRRGGRGLHVLAVVRRDA